MARIYIRRGGKLSLLLLLTTSCFQRGLEGDWFPVTIAKLSCFYILSPFSYAEEVYFSCRCEEKAGSEGIGWCQKRFLGWCWRTLSVSASPPKSNKCSCHMVLFLQLWLSVAFIEEVKYWLALWRWFVFSKYWLGLLNSNLKWNLSIVNMLCLRETGSCNLAAQFNAFTLFSLLSVILPKAGMSAERDAKLSSPRYSTRLVTSAWPCFLIMYLQHINIGI